MNSVSKEAMESIGKLVYSFTNIQNDKLLIFDRAIVSIDVSNRRIHMSNGETHELGAVAFLNFMKYLRYYYGIPQKMIDDLEESIREGDELI